MQLEPEMARRLKVLVARWSRINSFLGMKPESAWEFGCMFGLAGTRCVQRRQQNDSGYFQREREGARRVLVENGWQKASREV